MKRWNNWNIMRFSGILLILLPIAIVITIHGCAQTKEVKGKPLFFQNLPGLHESNGRIVASEEYTLDGEHQRVEGFRISYLSDGLKITGYLFKPREVSHPLPVLIYCRGGGPIIGRVDRKVTDYLAFLASKDYLVLASMYRGSCGSQGRDQFGGNDVRDVLNLLPLAESLPFADADRIGMLGFSRGGMMTLLSIKAGANIRAAAIVGAMTDLAATYREEKSWLRRLGLRFLIGAPVDESEAYKQRSAVYWAENIRVPLLILHGSADPKISVSQARRLAEKLRSLGAIHELVVYEGGDHDLDTDAFDRDRRVIEWFDNRI